MFTEPFDNEEMNSFLENELENIADYIVVEEIMGVSIPKTTLPVGEGRNIAVLVESAVTKFILKQMGMNSMDSFQEGVIQNIRNSKE